MVGMVGQTLGHYRIVEKIGLAGGRDLYSSSRRGALMNVRTALISSALLLAVLGWACEQQGPASPSALATPGGGSLGAAGGVSLDAPGGAILGVKKDCENKPEDDPRCEPKDGGGKTSFEAAITNPDHTGFPDLPDFPGPTVTSVGTFPVDNKCNSENIVDMVDVDRRDLKDDSRLTLTHLALEVKKCRNPFSGVKVRVAADDGTNFVTRYLPGNPSEFLEDSVTLHVHANAWLVRRTNVCKLKRAES